MKRVWWRAIYVRDEDQLGLADKLLSDAFTAMQEAGIDVDIDVEWEHDDEEDVFPDEQEQES